MLKSYQKKFLDKIHQKTYDIKGLELLVIYGSYVRNELTSKSDVDFFAMFHDRKSLEKGEERLYNILTTECDVEINLPASLYAVSEDEGMDKSIFYGILTEGYMITPAISNYLLKIINPSPQVIFTYTMDELSLKRRLKLIRSCTVILKRKKIKNMI